MGESYFVGLRKKPCIKKPSTFLVMMKAFCLKESKVRPM